MAVRSQTAFLPGWPGPLSGVIGRGRLALTFTMSPSDRNFLASAAPWSLDPGKEGMMLHDNLGVGKTS